MPRKVFYPASFNNIMLRDEQANVTIDSELYDYAERAIPGIVDRLRQQFGEEGLVQTAIVYGDRGSIENLFGIIRGSMYQLNWKGVWRDSETFLEQCEIVGNYNKFSVYEANRLVGHFSDKKFRLRRDGSVAIDIGPVSEAEYRTMRNSYCNGAFGEDRTSCEDGVILMIRWD